MLGGGYYWAINRSYDATYRAQLFTQRGFAHHVDFRGKPNEKTDFNYILYGVNDRGQLVDGERRPAASGYLMSFIGRSELARRLERASRCELSQFLQVPASFHGVVLRGDLLGGPHQRRIFRRTGKPTPSMSSPGVWRTSSARNENDKVSLRRLPSVEFRSRDRQVSERVLPVWVSFDSSASFLRRNELGNPTRAVRRPSRFRAARDHGASLERHPSHSVVFDPGDALRKQPGLRRAISPATESCAVRASFPPS